MSKFKINTRLLIEGIIITILGLLLCFIKADTLIKIVFIIIGILIILGSINDLIIGYKLKDKVKLISSIIDIILAIILIFFHNIVFLIVIALYLLIYPIIRIFKNPNHYLQFKFELPRLLLAIVLLILSPQGILNILFIILGIFMIVIGILTILGSFSKIKII